MKSGLLEETHHTTFSREMEKLTGKKKEMNPDIESEQFNTKEITNTLPDANESFFDKKPGNTNYQT
jgi:hypothetical protein